MAARMRIDTGETTALLVGTPLAKESTRTFEFVIEQWMGSVDGSASVV
jgi:hypothetical protein